MANRTMETHNIKFYMKISIKIKETFEVTFPIYLKDDDITICVDSHGFSFMIKIS